MRSSSGRSAKKSPFWQEAYEKCLDRIGRSSAVSAPMETAQRVWCGCGNATHESGFRPVVSVTGWTKAGHATEPSPDRPISEPTFVIRRKRGFFFLAPT